MSALTATRLRELLHYDPETGVFTWSADGLEAGWLEKGTGYRRIGIDGRSYLSSRLAWLWMTGEWPANTVDHWDTDKANNRWLNLRDVTGTVNQQNQRKAHRGSSTGLLGAYPNGKRFMARIVVDGQQTYIGTFDTPEQAHAAYVEEKKLRHPGNTIKQPLEKTT